MATRNSGTSVRSVASSSSGAGYLLAQLVRPLGVIATLALLSRGLSSPEFSRFLVLYAVADLASVLVDAGARHELFGRLRRSDGGDVAALLREERHAQLYRVLTFASLAVVVGAMLGLAAEVSAVCAVAATLPVSDPSLIAARALRRPWFELKALMCETLVVLILVGVVGSSLSGATQALWVLAALGLIRHLGSAAVLQGSLSAQEPADLDPSVDSDEGWRSSVGALRRPVVASLALSNLVGRLPQLFFFTILLDAEFVVFATWWALARRSQLVLNAGILQFYEPSALRRVARSAAGLGVLVGVALSSATALGHRFLVPLYLGSAYEGTSEWAIPAAILAIGALPVFALRTVLAMWGRSQRAAAISCLQVLLLLGAWIVSSTFGLPYGVLLGGYFVATVVLGHEVWQVTGGSNPGGGEQHGVLT